MAHTKSSKQILFSGLVFFAAFGSAVSQVSKAEVRPESPSDCGYVKLVISGAVAETATSETIAVFIFHRGKTEKSLSISKSRIRTLSTYVGSLINSDSSFRLAEGSVRDGLGSVEVFLKGKLSAELFFKKDRDLGDACFADPY